jgi:hypothetical protein
MHGTEHRIPERRAFRFSAPRKPFSPAPGLTLQSTPQPDFSRTGPIARNGLSLAKNGSRFRGFHSRVKVPGLLLRIPANRFRCPFGPSAPQPWPVRPDAGWFYASGPLQPSRPARRTASPVSTPLQGIYTLPDQSVPLGLPPFGPPSKFARSPLAPRRSILLLGMSFGSTLLVRYVFGGLLFLKPLGTFLTMLPIVPAVNIFL